MLHLEIVTPDRLFFSEEIKMVIVRGIEGDLAIMKNRAPITTPLKIGRVVIMQGDKERIAAVVDGYISVTENKATIVTEAAEWPEEIDVERAEAAKARAEKILADGHSELDTARAEAALKRAINRLEIKDLK